MIELMIAMVATLIIGGAVVGLLTGGNNAFRREPELADRQQNIRMAMDMITKDVVTAGGGMNLFVQAFTNNLNNPPLASGAVPSALVPGENSDILQIMANDGSCPSLDVCGAPGNSLFFNEPVPACLLSRFPILGYVYGQNGQQATSNPNGPMAGTGILYFDKTLGGGGCGTSHLNKPAGQNVVNPSGSQACGSGGNANTNTAQCQFMTAIQLVRYEIAPDPDDPNTPSLWRSPSGTVDAGGTNGANQPPAPPWQVVAKGIEDMQIRYFTDAAQWQDSPGVVQAQQYNTIVRQVQITLSARSTAANLQGQTTSPVGSAVRGQLVSIVSPRAAQLALQQGNLWR
jgi:hypothetical protein